MSKIGRDDEEPPAILRRFRASFYEVVETMILHESSEGNRTSFVDRIEEMQKLTIKEESP